MTSLCDAALDVLQTASPKDKAEKTRRHITRWRAGEIPEVGTAALPSRPARPEKPVLLSPAEMPKRAKAGSKRSKIALLHALAHIELNAIDLSWDIMARGFDLGDFHLPKAFLMIGARSPMTRPSIS